MTDAKLPRAESIAESEGGPILMGKETAKMHALPPELQRLVDLGLMSRDEAIEADTFMDALTDAVDRGEITAEQAVDLGAMLGAHDAQRAVRRAS